MTPIRKTIARAVERYMRLPEEADEIWDEVLRALDEAGLVVVPKEPSDLAIRRGGSVYDHPSVFMGGPSRQGLRVVPKIYRAMIAAAPDVVE